MLLATGPVCAMDMCWGEACLAPRQVSSVVRGQLEPGALQQSHLWCGVLVLEVLRTGAGEAGLTVTHSFRPLLGASCSETGPPIMSLGQRCREEGSQD